MRSLRPVSLFKKVAVTGSAGHVGHCTITDLSNRLEGFDRNPRGGGINITRDHLE